MAVLNISWLALITDWDSYRQKLSRAIKSFTTGGAGRLLLDSAYLSSLIFYFRSSFNVEISKMYFCFLSYSYFLAYYKGVYRCCVLTSKYDGHMSITWTLTFQVLIFFMQILFHSIIFNVAHPKNKLVKTIRKEC